MNVTLTADPLVPPRVTIHTAPGLDPFAVLTITDSRGAQVNVEFLNPTTLLNVAVAATVGQMDLREAQTQPPLTEEDVPL